MIQTVGLKETAGQKESSAMAGRTHTSLLHVDLGYIWKISILDGLRIALIEARRCSLQQQLMPHPVI